MTNKQKITVHKIRGVTPWFPYESIWPRWIRLLEFNVRVKIFKQPHYFIDKWTIEKLQNIECDHGINLEEELAIILREEIEKEIKENGSCTWEEFCKRGK